MRLNKRQLWMIKNDLILKEATLTDGSLSTIMNKMKGPLKEFGEVVSSAVKLVAVDVNFLLKLTIGSWLMGPDKRSELKREKNSRRKNYLDKVVAGMDMSKMSGDNAVMCMMLAPGAFIVGKGLQTIPNPLSASFRGRLQDMGFTDVLPFGLGKIIEPDYVPGRGLFDELQRADSDEALLKILQTKMGVKGGGTNKDTLGIPHSAMALTALFLVGKEAMKEYSEPEGTLILEGDDEEYEPSKEDLQRLQKAIEVACDRAFQPNVEAIIKIKKKELKDYFGDTPKAVELVATLTGTDSLEEFTQTLNKMKEAMGSEAGEFSMDKLGNSITKSREAIRADKESMEKLKKQFEEAKEEPTEEALNEKIDTIILSSFKGQFIQQVKGQFEDLLENTEAEIWDGMTQKEKDMVKKTKAGQEYHKLCKKYEDQISDALSKLKQT